MFNNVIQVQTISLVAVTYFTHEEKPLNMILKQAWYLSQGLELAVYTKPDFMD